MSTVYEQMVAKVEQISSGCIHSNVLKNKPLHEVFNAITGTTFDQPTFEAVAESNPELLQFIIPGGTKTIITPDDAVGAPIVEHGKEVTVDTEVPTPEEVEAHKGSTVQLDLDKYDLDQDGDIDDDDVAAANEVHEANDGGFN